MQMSENTRQDRLTEILGKTLEHTANEAVVLARLEEFFAPKPAKLAASDTEAEALHRRVDRVIELLGGPPTSDTQGDNCVHHDVYPLSAVSEVLNTFHRARKSVCRTHMFMIGIGIQEQIPDVWIVSDATERDAIMESCESAFWEHAETSFIRLAGFWDRVGQVLAFAFFGIRQFERDGFTSVMDLIKSLSQKRVNGR